MSKLLNNILNKINDTKTLTVEVEKNGEKGYFEFNAYHNQQQQLKISFVISNFINKYQNQNLEKEIESEEYVKAYTSLLNIINENILSIKIYEKFLELSEEVEILQIDVTGEGFEEIKNFIFKDINFTTNLLSLYLVKINQKKEMKEKIEKK